ncbi:Fpg/Nei family DNA glycosylase [Streptomyces sp. NPDC001231]|uniref:Fpg/Nei family DNA glycosylase n=1 Tax=Streptomyces sp. NPDC001231 TaxID=3364549 RepID=UPI0036B7CAC4
MPELPDVEGFREVLMTCGRQRCVTDVEVRDTGVLRGVSAQRFRRGLKGRRLGEGWRHGKWLFVPVDDGGRVLVWHFGMTGSLRCCAPDEPLAPHDRIVLTLDDSRHLRYRDQRKLQGVQLADDAQVARITDGLGPDALTLSGAELRKLLSGRRRAIKSALMDQSVIAGLGNLLCDEILWRARVAPRTPARDLSDPRFGVSTRGWAGSLRHPCAPGACHRVVPGSPGTGTTASRHVLAAGGPCARTASADAARSGAPSAGNERSDRSPVSERQWDDGRRHKATAVRGSRCESGAVPPL